MITAHIGGSARGYQEPCTAADPTKAEQAGGQAIFLCIVSGRLELPLLPLM
jgi:hypothetical protein